MGETVQILYLSFDLLLDFFQSYYCFHNGNGSLDKLSLPALCDFLIVYHASFSLFMFQNLNMALWNLNGLKLFLCHSVSLDFIIEGHSPPTLRLINLCIFPDLIHCHLHYHLLFHDLMSMLKVGLLSLYHLLTHPVCCHPQHEERYYHFQFSSAVILWIDSLSFCHWILSFQSLT